MFVLRASKIGIRDVTDGTSNTLFVGEDKISRGPGQWDIQHWMDPMSMTTTVRGVNHAGDPVANGYYAQGFGSYHVGGAQFLLVDGTVRFLSENMNIITFCNLGTKAGSEMVGEF
jgi:hypothetical protein